LAFQIAFSADCISPNTPDAVTIRAPRPIRVAMAPEVSLLALWIAVCSRSVLAFPIRVWNWSVRAVSAASSPKTKPTIARMISMRGARAVTA